MKSRVAGSLAARWPISPVVDILATTPSTLEA
jgi:hypothetical protein